MITEIQVDPVRGAFGLGLGSWLLVWVLGLVVLKLIPRPNRTMVVLVFGKFDLGIAVRAIVHAHFAAEVPNFHPLWVIPTVVAIPLGWIALPVCPSSHRLPITSRVSAVVPFSGETRGGPVRRQITGGPANDTTPVMNFAILVANPVGQVFVGATHIINPFQGSITFVSPPHSILVVRYSILQVCAGYE